MGQGKSGQGRQLPVASDMQKGMGTGTGLTTRSPPAPPMLSWEWGKGGYLLTNLSRSVVPSYEGQAR